jgi:ribonuclease E
MLPLTPENDVRATTKPPKPQGVITRIGYMTRKMIINAVDPEEVRIAILRDRLLEDFDIETRGVEKNKGNIYKGVVMAVEPALNAAFVNYGADKQGFLTANDVHPKFAHDGSDGDKAPKIANLLKPKQTVLVQVSKDEVGSKGAVLTTFLSLAGRYLVLMPDSETQGVSRKIEDEDTRRKVREAAAKLDVPDNMGVIIRTAGRDRTKLDLNRDLRVLLRLWDNIQKEAARAKAPALIFKEQDVIIRALRDYFSADIDEIVLDSDEAYDRAAEYMHMVMPNHRSALTRYVERRPIFHHYRIEEQLDVIYSPKVTLPSGGSIVIESTEALVAIDVNSGKQKSANQEDTATQTNVEAAAEVGRQLRLRDLGGIIVTDFIDMAARKNQQKVERALKEALRTDKARVKVSRISRNGTLEITRQRIRSALNASVFDKCGVCRGTGHVLNPGSHAISVLRKLRDRASRGDLRSAKVRVEPEVANRLRTENWSALQEVERRYGIRVEVLAEHSFASGQDDFTFETNPDAVVIPLEEPNFGPAPRPDYGDAPPPEDVWADDEDDLRRLDLEEAEDEDEDEEDELAAAEEEDDMETESRSEESRGRRRRGRRGARREETGRPSAGARVSSRGERGREDAAERGDHTLDIPSFEFIDPAQLRGLLARRPRPIREAGEDELPMAPTRARAGGRGERADRRDEPRESVDERSGRRRRRRRGRGEGAPRLEEANVIRASEALRDAPPVAVAAGGGAKAADQAPKRGFFSRLFGWGK